MTYLERVVERSSRTTSVVKVDGVQHQVRKRIRNDLSLVSPAMYVADLTVFPVDEDRVRGRILAFDAYYDAAGTAVSLQYTANGSDWVEIANISDSVFADAEAGFTPAKFASVCVLPNGYYLLNVITSSINRAWNATACASKMFRSIDGGATWTESTFTNPATFDEGGNNIYASKGQGMPYGYIPPFGWHGVDLQSDGQYIGLAEYGNKTDASGVHALSTYVSSDYGATFQWVYRRATAVDRHHHLAVFEPGSNHSVLWCSYGDGAGNAGLLRIVNSGTPWTLEQSLEDWSRQPIAAYVIGDYIYWGSDSAYLPLITRHNVHTGEMTSSIRAPEIQSSVRYISAYTPGYCWQIKKVNGVLFAFADQNAFGVWASTNGDDWTPFVRVPAGALNRILIAGELNGVLYCGRSTGSLGVTYTMPTATSLGMCVASHGIKNEYTGTKHDDCSYASADEITAGGTAGWLSTEAANFDPALAPGLGRNGGNAFTFTRTIGEAFNRISSPRISSIITAEELRAGDLITFTCWVKVGTDWSDDVTIGNAASVNATVTQYLNGAIACAPGRWIPLSISWLINDPTSGDFSTDLMRPKIQFSNATSTTNASITIGGISAVVTRGRDVMGCEPDVFGTVEHEPLIAGLGATGDEWTIVFAWKPEFGILNVKAANTVIPICTLLGTLGGQVSLFWSNDSTGGNAIYMQSPDHGGAAAKVGGTSEYAPYLSDAVFVALRGKSVTYPAAATGCYTLATIFDPVNGYTEAFGYDLGDDGSEALFYLNGLPASLVLGATEDGTAAWGRFGCVRMFDEILSDEDLAVQIVDLQESINRKYKPRFLLIP